MDVFIGAIAQVLSLAGLLYMGIYSWRMSRVKMPFVLSPGFLLCISTGVGSLSSYVLEPSDFSAYMVMWLLQVAGMLAGLAVTHVISQENVGVEMLTLNRRRLLLFAIVLFGAGVLSAIAFFAMQGVPALQSDLEQARVDAATGGTGYFRLLAYMTIPASLILYSIRVRGWYFAVGCSLIILVGMANRSPLLYLFGPMIFVSVVVARRRVGSARIAIVAGLLAVLVVSAGVYRIFSQSEFRLYAEYREDLYQGNVLGIAETSLTHYAEVVADNAILSKHLVDVGTLPMKFGTSYFTLFLTALPGEQLSLDREIKDVTNKSFIGGGTPPTLMGEGYINFGYPGIVIAGFVAAALLNLSYRRVVKIFQNSDRDAVGFAALVYGFFGTWITLAQVAGFAGASTFPMAMFLVYLTARATTTKRFFRHVTAARRGGMGGSAPPEG